MIEVIHLHKNGNVSELFPYHLPQLIAAVRTYFISEKSMPDYSADKRHGNICHKSIDHSTYSSGHDNTNGKFNHIARCNKILNSFHMLINFMTNKG